MTYWKCWASSKYYKTGETTSAKSSICKSSPVEYTSDEAMTAEQAGALFLEQCYKPDTFVEYKGAFSDDFIFVYVEDPQNKILKIKFNIIKRPKFYHSNSLDVTKLFYL